ncbi:MAG: bifunctional 2-dehydro-3-deoxy-phosphogluconate/2-dehydro-3-deoxy-6-phosphogalactonate aldolase, partial [Sulfolobaceae archaeon]
MEIISPIITPFNKYGEVDKEKLKFHAKNLLDKGIDALFINGTTGMGPSLNFREKLEVLRTISDVTNKIIFQIGSLDMKEVLYLIDASKDFDIIAIASYPPYYYPKITRKNLIRYFKTLCEKSKHPVYLYNYPLASGKDVDASIAKEIECLAGVKDSVENIMHSMEYKRLLPSMKVFNGSNSLVLASLTLGLDGSIPSGSNFLPEIYVGIREAIKNGNKEKAMELQFIILEIFDIIREYDSIPAIYVLTRYFQGYDVGYPREPLYALDDGEAKEIISKLERIKERLMGA